MEYENDNKITLENIVKILNDQILFVIKIQMTYHNKNEFFARIMEFEKMENDNVMQIILEMIDQ